MKYLMCNSTQEANLKLQEIDKLLGYPDSIKRGARAYTRARVTPKGTILIPVEEEALEYLAKHGFKGTEALGEPEGLGVKSKDTQDGE